jgi:hypothetical protein
VLAGHALRTTSGQADQAAERLGLLRRAQQRHLGWMEAHDADLRVQERAVAREDAWRRRVDQRALALDPPGWLLAELGPSPPTQARGGCGAWPPRNWTATGAPTAWINPGQRSMAGGDSPGTGARLCRPPRSPASRPAGPAGSRSAAAAATSDGGRSAAPDQPRPTAGRRALSPGARPPPRLAACPGRAGAPERPLAPPPRAHRPPGNPRPRPPGTPRSVAGRSSTWASITTRRPPPGSGRRPRRAHLPGRRADRAGT